MWHKKQICVRSATDGENLQEERVVTPHSLQIESRLPCKGNAGFSSTARPKVRARRARTPVQADALRSLRIRVGRVHHEVERRLDRVAPCQRDKTSTLLARTKLILTQRRKSSNKLHALHAPEFECIAKGKARTPYEFGVKVSIVTTLKEGLVFGACSMSGNPYDGHTLHDALESSDILCDVKPKMVFVDRGCRGVDIDGVRIWRSASIQYGP